MPRTRMKNGRNLFMTLILTILRGTQGWSCNRLDQSTMQQDVGEITWVKLVDMQIERGDIILLHDKTIWIANSADHLHSVKLLRGVFKVAHISVSQIVYPERSLATKFKPTFPEGWSAEQAVTLLVRLIGKKLPYGAWLCNGSDYMRYIVYSKIWRPKYKPACPLRRSLTDLTPEEINSPGFYLLNGQKKNSLVYIDQMPKLKQTENHRRKDAGLSPDRYNPSSHRHHLHNKDKQRNVTIKR